MLGLISVTSSKKWVREQPSFEKKLSWRQQGNTSSGQTGPLNGSSSLWKKKFKEGWQRHVFVSRWSRAVLYHTAFTVNTCKANWMIKVRERSQKGPMQRVYLRSERPSVIKQWPFLGFTQLPDMTWWSVRQENCQTIDTMCGPLYSI